MAAALEEFTSQNKENAMDVNEVKEVREKIDTLQEAVALLAKTVAEHVDREVLTPKSAVAATDDAASSNTARTKSPPRRKRKTSQRHHASRSERPNAPNG